MQTEKKEIYHIKTELETSSKSNSNTNIAPNKTVKMMLWRLLQKQNQILQIKKINLVRLIIEEKEV